MPTRIQLSRASVALGRFNAHLAFYLTKVYIPGQINADDPYAKDEHKPDSRQRALSDAIRLR